MYLYSQSSLFIHYTVPCRHCTLTYLDTSSCICIQASTLASPLIYNSPSQYRYISVLAHVINLRFYLVSIHAGYTTVI